MTVVSRMWQFYEYNYYVHNKAYTFVSYYAILNL